MKYVDGRAAKVGDRVKLWDNCYGIVVVSIDDKIAEAKYNVDDWLYLSHGIVIKLDNEEIIHYDKPDEDFQLIE